jgi:hypothetical protein
MNSFSLPRPQPGQAVPQVTPWVRSAQLRSEQRVLVEQEITGSCFFEGPAGSGKTTAAVHRALRILNNLESGENLLVIVPQRSLASPYLDMLEYFPELNTGRMNVLTLGGLARRAAELFWPQYAGEAGFSHPGSMPVFLTLETATYMLANTIQPILEGGAFEGVTIERNQLYRQILDNLNKTALVGFPLQEIGTRLSEAWVGPADQVRIYTDAQLCARAFREACLRSNMLDFSLQVEIFFRYIIHSEIFQPFRRQLATHLIADNIEEDTPRAHDLLRAWMPDLRSALLIFDTQAGFRRFLGADPLDAYELKSRCTSAIQVQDTFVSSREVELLGKNLAAWFGMQNGSQTGDSGDALHVEVHRYLPDSIEWIASEIESLIAHDGTPASDIAILAPYLSDSMRFLLGRALEERGIEWIAYRPSRPIRQEPTARSLLTLAALAHPQWGHRPSAEDLGRMLSDCIADLDPVRADLFAKILYKPSGARLWLQPFGQLRGEMQDRLTFTLGQRYETLRTWLAAYIESPGLALDHFLRRLFGEILTQPGFGYQDDLTGGSIAATLIDSVYKFRWILTGSLEPEESDSGLTYLELVREGVVSAQDIRLSSKEVLDAVSIMPAFTFLMMNRPVDFQFWLDIGSQGWAERIYQPLTHPYVLNRQWQRGNQWTDTEETSVRDQIAATLCLGLSRRCKKRIYAVWSEIDERGYEQRGPLLRALQHTLRSKGDGSGG